MEPFEYSGIWWLPKQPDRQVSGVLNYDPNDRAVLELIGSFKETKEIGRFGSEDIILEVTSNGKIVKLYKCIDYGLQLTTPGFMSSRYLVTVIFIGHHFPDDQSLLFKSISINYEHLHEWTRITGFKWQFNHDKDGGLGQETLSYSFPETVSANIDDFTHSFHHNYSSAGDRIQDIMLKQTTFWKVEPNKETHCQFYHEQIFFHVQNFLTLAINHPIRPKRIIEKAEAAKQTLNAGQVVYSDIEVLYSIAHRASETPC